MIVSQSAGVLQSSFTDLWYTVVQFLPAILAAIIIFVIGWIVGISIFLMTVTLHEFAHGAVAFVRGDRTAREMGRLTLNPLRHIDWFWTVLFPVMLFFSWAWS